MKASFGGDAVLREAKADAEYGGQRACAGGIEKKIRCREEFSVISEGELKLLGEIKKTMRGSK